MRTSPRRQNPYARWALAGACIALILAGCAEGPIAPVVNDMIIDHECRTLASILQEWIESEKAELRIAYGHTSHGSQLITGMTGCVRRHLVLVRPGQLRHGG